MSGWKSPSLIFLMTSSIKVVVGAKDMFSLSTLQYNQVQFLHIYNTYIIHIYYCRTLNQRDGYIKTISLCVMCIDNRFPENLRWFEKTRGFFEKMAGKLSWQLQRHHWKKLENLNPQRRPVSGPYSWGSHHVCSKSTLAQYQT